MPIDPDNLPSDVATLKAMVAAQQTELVAARAGLLEQRYEIEALRARLAPVIFADITPRGRSAMHYFDMDAGPVRLRLRRLGGKRLHGLDPEAYLRHVFERIADYPVDRAGDLLPWNTTGLQQASPRNLECPSHQHMREQAGTSPPAANR